MTDLATEREHLVKAERDVAEGEARILRQTEFLTHMRDADQDVRQAETLLENLKETLQTWKDHRDEILRTISRLEGRGI